MILKLKGNNGLPVLVNTDHILFVDTPAEKSPNGNGRPVVAIGKAVIIFVGGANVVVSHSVEEVAQMIPSSSFSLLRETIK